MVNLFPDQSDMIERVVRSLQRGNKAVLLQSPTGSGKSVMASEIVRRAVAKGSSAWFMVPRRELIRQMSATFNDFDIRHGYISAGSKYRPMQDVYICGTDTIKTRLTSLAPPRLAIVDETHYGGDGLDRIIKWLELHGTTILGLSATPWKLSGQGLGCWYADMVLGPSIKELIEAGRLSDYRPFAPDVVDLSRLKITGGDYAKGQLAEKMEQDRVLIGNAVKHYKSHAEGKLNIAYCVSIAHSQIVAQAFKDQGVPAAHIDGTTPDDERKRIIRAYANRELKVLTNCELLTFGFDLASQVGMDVTVECMSDLRPTKSLALQMQKWGRVLRRKDYPAIIFDHANNFKEHDLPCDDRHWTLEDRERGNRRQGERVEPVRHCWPGCGFCHKPAPVCPNCGKVYEVQSREIEEIEGELGEIDKERERKQKKKETRRGEIERNKNLPPDKKKEKRKYMGDALRAKGWSEARIYKAYIGSGLL